MYLSPFLCRTSIDKTKTFYVRSRTLPAIGSHKFVILSPLGEDSYTEQLKLDAQL